MQRVYLDHNATTPVDPDVFGAMRPFYEKDFGNPSSIHVEGVKARQVLEESRESVAAAFECDANEIYFTSGGTESANMAVQGVVARALQQKQGPVHVVTTSVEHQAVLQSVKGLE